MENPTREKLINAAIELFALEGYSATSIRQITKRAGVNSSLISYYFNGKQGLYRATLENQFDSVLQFIKKTSTENLSPENIIKEYAYTIEKINRKSPLFSKIIFREILEPSKALNEIIAKRIKSLFDILSQAIQEGINKKIFRDDIDIHYIVLMIAGIINFYFLARPIRTELIAENEMIDEVYLEKALNVLLNGIKHC